MEFNLINKYHVSMLPYFLDKLKNSMDGDKDLLERSMIVFGSPMGDSNLHTTALPAHRARTCQRTARRQTCISRRRTARDGERVPDAAAQARRGRCKELWRQHGRVRTQRLIEPQLRGEESLMTVHSKMSCKMLGALAAVALLASANRRARTGRRGKCSQTQLSTPAATAKGSPLAEPRWPATRRPFVSLLASGANCERRAGRRHDGAHWAAQRGDLTTAKALIKAHANVRPRTRIGSFTPLQIAAKMAKRPSFARC